MAGERNHGSPRAAGQPCDCVHAPRVDDGIAGQIARHRWRTFGLCEGIRVQGQVQTRLGGGDRLAAGFFQQAAKNPLLKDLELFVG